MVRDILFSTRENIDFIHEVFRQALRLCFRYSVAMKTVINCYSDWIKMAVSRLGSSVLLGVRGPTNSERLFVIHLFSVLT